MSSVLYIESSIYICWDHVATWFLSTSLNVSQCRFWLYDAIFSLSLFFLATSQEPGKRGGGYKNARHAWIFTKRQSWLILFLWIEEREKVSVCLLPFCEAAYVASSSLPLSLFLPLWSALFLCTLMSVSPSAWVLQNQLRFQLLWGKASVFLSLFCFFFSSFPFSFSRHVSLCVCLWHKRFNHSNSCQKSKEREKINPRKKAGRTGELSLCADWEAGETERGQFFASFFTCFNLLLKSRKQSLKH